MKITAAFRFVPVLLLLAACSSEVKEQKDLPKKEDLTKILNGREAGVVGVFDMPEMLTISILDSSAAKDISFHMAKDYTVLEEEAREIGAELDGKSPAVINYNADPNNLKFECFLLIKKIPEKQPKQSKIVALEAGNMLVYNFYGPYDKLSRAYNAIKIYCIEHSLKLAGPVREFYLSDPVAEQNPEKWLTRIIVPVESLK